jgi:single-stranded-DNA-specific exonuclease
LYSIQVFVTELQMTMKIKQRTLNPEVYSSCIDSGYPEIIARIIAGRTNAFDKNIFDFSLDAIQPAMSMAGVPEAVSRISYAIDKQQTILIFTDYDVDGCTSMAILHKALHQVFEVPESDLVQLTGHRTEDGYGLTDSIADKIIDYRPDLVITADAGVSDNQRIKKLADAGIDVIITDHHLVPKTGAPEAAVAVVNPQQENCPYDPEIAGCGVAWLLMTALAQNRGCSIAQKRTLHELLDYVALGTVADMASLGSVINRYFVRQGLAFMNQRARPCWQQSLNDKPAGVGQLGFQIGPRVNASSRMTGRADLAIDFLLSADMDQVCRAYDELETHNRKRQAIEAEILLAARKRVRSKAPAIVYYSESNHAGIQGIVASKLSETFGKPAIMLADVADGMVSGSGRAGQFLHLQAALETLDENMPGLLISFGGHKAAAGLKIHKTDIQRFTNGFYEVVLEQLKGQDTKPFKETDGSLNGYINLETCYQIERLQPFGIGFPTPTFYDQMEARFVRVIGKTQTHLSMMLDHYKAVFFNALETPESPWPVSEGQTVGVIYTLNVNEWQGRKSVQLFVRDVVG